MHQVGSIYKRLFLWYTTYGSQSNGVNTHANSVCCHDGILKTRVAEHGRSNINTHTTDTETCFYSSVPETTYLVPPHRNTWCFPGRRLLTPICLTPVSTVFVTQALKKAGRQRSVRTQTNEDVISLILRRSRTGTVWFYTSTNNNRAARPKLYTKSLTRDLKRVYSRFTLVRISINL